MEFKFIISAVLINYWSALHVSIDRFICNPYSKPFPIGKGIAVVFR